MTRYRTFYRNRAVIDEKYGKVHKEAMGEDTSLNKFGYPDMGNNLYSDLLPFKDWIMINNAQRQHEVGYASMMVLFPNAFITALCFPRVACTSLATFFLLRLHHISGWTSSRGFNNAFFVETLLQAVTTYTVLSAGISACHILGLTIPLIRMGVWLRSTRLAGPFKLKKNHKL